MPYHAFSVTRNFRRRSIFGVPMAAPMRMANGTVVSSFENQSLNELADRNVKKSPYYHFAAVGLECRHLFGHWTKSHPIESRELPCEQAEAERRRFAAPAPEARNCADRSATGTRLARRQGRGSRRQAVGGTRFRRSLE